MLYRIAQLNPLVQKALRGSHAVLFGCGSLYTSICPSLIVRGVGEEIAASGAGVPKVLLLNGSPDRETKGMSAVDYVAAITHALNRREQSHRESHDQQQPRGAAREPPRDVTAFPRHGRQARAHDEEKGSDGALGGARRRPRPASGMAVGAPVRTSHRQGGV